MFKKKRVQTGWHINNDGDHKPCYAQVGSDGSRGCDFEIHGDTPELARDAYAESMKEIEQRPVTRDDINRVYDRSAGRWCDRCQQHGSHATDRHDEFAAGTAELLDAEEKERAQLEVQFLPNEVKGRLAAIYGANYDSRCLRCDTHGSHKTEEHGRFMDDMERLKSEYELESYHYDIDTVSAEDIKAVYVSAGRHCEICNEWGSHHTDRHDHFAEGVLAQRRNLHALQNSETYRNVKKMPALFVIDRVNHVGTTEINEKAAWVFDEPSIATIKRDGTSVTVDEEGNVWARRSVKKGKTAPEGYIEAEVDPVTGHSFGLEPIENSSFKKFFDQALDSREEPFMAGTYELCGPKINGNPEGLESAHLYEHGAEEAVEIPDMTNVRKEEAYEMLRNIFSDYKARGIEGVVWAGEDGKRTKLRTKDFFGDENR